MRRISGHFEDLHFTESHFGPLSVEEGVLKVPVSGLLTLRGHPLCDGTLNPISGHLVFNVISRSIKK
ncbi:hypothethical protein (plasmid) [Ralstonia solanacearum CMR15]|nr:hypothethical protein [Ralstonia solanacearum CMR15]